MIAANLAASSKKETGRPVAAVDLLPVLCLVALGIAVSWMSLGDDRTTTKGWFLAWYQQFRTHGTSDFPYSPFPPTAILLEGGIPSLLGGPSLGDDIWHMIVLSLLGPVLYIGFRLIANSLISFASAAVWVCLTSTDAGTFIGGYFETASLFTAASCTLALYAYLSRPTCATWILVASGFSAFVAAGVKQSFLPFVVAFGFSLLLTRTGTESATPDSRVPRGGFFVLGSFISLVIQVVAWKVFFPKVDVRVGLSRFVSGGGKSDSLLVLISSAANSLATLNAIVPTAVVVVILLAFNRKVNEANLDRLLTAESAIAMGSVGFFLWTMRTSPEANAFRLLGSLWFAILFVFYKRRLFTNARLLSAVILAASSLVFLLSFRELIVPERQSYLVTLRGLAAAPHTFGTQLASLIGLVGLMSVGIDALNVERKEFPIIRITTVALGILIVFQIPLGGFLLTGHLFGFGMITMFGSLSNQHADLFQFVSRGCIIMLALSGVAREASTPYEWYGVLGSNDLAHIRDNGVFLGRGAAEAENRFEHWMLSHELALLKDDSDVLVGVRNAGLVVGHDHLQFRQECLVLWLDICPEERAAKVLEEALQGNFDFALWSPENPDVLFANTLMWRDHSSQIGNPSPTAVAQLQAWLLSLVEAEPWRLVHVAWPEREYGTETLLVDLRDVGDKLMS